jgi:hypothetical protein
VFRKNTLSTVVAIGALLAMTFGILLLSKSAQAGPVKLEVCHIPPDNPDNFHTITVNEKALPAHFEHQDLNGACDGFCADLCDDGDLCTFEDSDDCESGGCPVPQPVDCGPGQICDAQQGCIPDPDLEPACPCYTAEDLAELGTPSSCSLSGDAVGVNYSNNALTCTGTACFFTANPVCAVLPSVGDLIGPIELDSVEFAGCVQIVQEYCDANSVPNTSSANHGAMMRSAAGGT